MNTCCFRARGNTGDLSDMASRDVTGSLAAHHARLSGHLSRDGRRHSSASRGHNPAFCNASITSAGVQPPARQWNRVRRCFSVMAKA
jgi:hypothetical protein